MEIVGVLIGAAVLFLCLGIKRQQTTRGDLASKLGVAKESTLPVIADSPNTRTPFFENLEQEARRAGLILTGRTLVLIAVASAGIIWVVTTLTTGKPLLACILSILGLAAPSRWIRIQKDRRAKQFVNQFDSALHLASSALQAGASLQQCFEEVAKNGPEPVSSEFARLVHAIHLGAAPAEAVKILEERLQGSEIGMFVIATEIFAKSGGNLGEIYSTIANTVTEHKTFRQSIKAHTAQSRVSASIVSVLPLVFVAFVYLRSPGYFDPLLNNPLGRIAFYSCFALIAIGWLLMKRVLDIAI